MSEENENNTSPEENQPESTPEDQAEDSQAADGKEDTGGEEEITPEEAEMLAMLEGGGDGGGDKGKAEEDMSSDEAATLAAAMAAISQVQGVADSAAPSPSSTPEPDTTAFEAPVLENALSPKAKEGMDLLSDVHMNVRIELGRTKMYVEDVLKLSDGAVVELDKLAGDPVDVFVNNRKVAKGEVLVLNDMFCVRISEIVDITAVDA